MPPNFQKHFFGQVTLPIPQYKGYGECWRRSESALTKSDFRKIFRYALPTAYGRLFAAYQGASEKGAIPS